ncbi:hypothetical protein SynBIOSU31_01199 [Synechococcus sp. BIOS-U3-1]|nr:hypothetical protein SynBIOSU31_01199 [Synechococcus sp. BIOS-U3-1]
MGSNSGLKAFKGFNEVELGCLRKVSTTSLFNQSFHFYF